VHALNKLPYPKHGSETIGEGVIFSTYKGLIASSDKSGSRLDQLVQWFGDGFDGLLIFDEVSNLMAFPPFNFEVYYY
jgi:hypothetical protein